MSDTRTDTVEHWRAQALYQQRRKHCWKLRFHIACAVLVGMACAVGAFWVGQKTVPQPVGMPRPAGRETPPHILASVLICNPGPTCSGTIISRGEKLAAGVSAAHCFTGIIGGKFHIYYPDGSFAEATLTAIDRQIDMAMFTVPADTVLATAPVTEAIPHQCAFDVCGYPAGQGPKYFGIDPTTPGEARGMSRARFSVKDGKIMGGNSGCGVFVNGALCGVLSDRETLNDGKTLYCSSHDQLTDFCKRHLPPKCGKGFCPAPEKPIAPPIVEGTVPPPWKPTPNVPIYTGHGKRPDDLDSDRDLAHELDVLRKKEIAELRKEIKEINETIDILRTQNGKDGKDGADGKDGKTGPQGPPGPGGGELDPAVLNELKIADQRNAGDIASLRKEGELLRTRLAELEKKQTAAEVKSQHQDVDIQRVNDRLTLVEKKLSGSVRITVRKDPTGNVSLEKGK